MKPLRTPNLTAALILILTPSLAGPAALAQTPEAGLLDALSLVSGGLLVPSDPPPQVTRDGDLYHVRVPLPALSSPPDAAIQAVGRPLDAGVWDITALTLPSAGALKTSGRQTPGQQSPAQQSPGQQSPAQGATAPGLVTFSIGQQAFKGRIDPTLATASPFKAQLGKITVRTDNPPQHTDQTIEQYSMDGTLSGDGNGRMNARALGSLTNWLITGAGGNPSETFRLSMRSAAIRYQVDGLDRTRAERLRNTGQTLTADRPTPAATTPGMLPNLSLSPATRERLHSMIDDFAALLTRFDVDETVQGVHFEAAGGNRIEIKAVRLGVAGQARDGRVNAHLELTVNDPVASMMPPDYASLMPQQVTIRPAISGLRSDALIQWMRDATAEGQDPTALQARTMALLNDPDAKVGIESLLIETGPLVVEGSARVLPLPGNMAGYDVHLTARGLDAMLATLQRNPAAMQFVPMIFLAKGMAKPEGDALVWDIGYAAGAVTVNGVPLGQSPARR